MSHIVPAGLELHPPASTSHKVEITEVCPQAVSCLEELPCLSDEMTEKPVQPPPPPHSFTHTTQDRNASSVFKVNTVAIPLKTAKLVPGCFLDTQEAAHTCFQRLGESHQEMLLPACCQVACAP